MFFLLLLESWKISLESNRRRFGPCACGLNILPTTLPRQITDRLIMSAMMRSVLMFNGNLGNSLWLMALGGPVGRCVSVMLNKNIYTEVGAVPWPL